MYISIGKKVDASERIDNSTEGCADSDGLNLTFLDFSNLAPTYWDSNGVAHSHVQHLVSVLDIVQKEALTFSKLKSDGADFITDGNQAAYVHLMIRHNHFL